MNIPKYPKAFALGTHHVKDALLGVVEITEKVDGSQFGFGRVKGVNTYRSKGVASLVECPNGMFDKAMNHCDKVIFPFLEEHGWDNIAFYAEYLRDPRHNAICYSRVPRNHMALWACQDLETGEWADHTGLTAWASYLDIDVVPILYQGPADFDFIKGLMDKESYLGGHDAEGVVVKNFGQPMWWRDKDYSFTVAKFVSEKFKEVNKSSWAGARHQNKLKSFMESFATEARYQKAVQHLRERGELKADLPDIGPLVREVHLDIEAEEKEEIGLFLTDYFLKDIKREATKGLPQWYKDQLGQGLIKPDTEYGNAG